MDREGFLNKINEAYSEFRKDEEAWREHCAELAEWDCTLLDGLKEEEFLDQLDTIEKDTCFHSNLSFVEQHPLFVKLVEKGEKLVPFLINCLREDPTWSVILLLDKVSTFSPVRDENWGKIHDMASDWIEWYEKLSSTE